MLTHPTLDQLNQLGLLGMAGAFGDMFDADTASLSHAEWLALQLEREISHRHDKRLAARLRYARLRHPAAVEDVDYRAVRGLDRAGANRVKMSTIVSTRIFRTVASWSCTKSIAHVSFACTAGRRSSRSFAFTRRFGVLFRSCRPKLL